MLARRSSLGQRMQEEEQCAATYISDTAATSQDGSSQKFIAPIAGMLYMLYSKVKYLKYGRFGRKETCSLFNKIL